MSDIPLHSLYAFLQTFSIRLNLLSVRSLFSSYCVSYGHFTLYILHTWYFHIRNNLICLHLLSSICNDNDNCALYNLIEINSLNQGIPITACFPILKITSYDALSVNILFLMVLPTIHRSHKNVCSSKKIVIQEKYKI